VDRFGLKARHLRKHRAAVEKFFRALEKLDYQTEVAVALRKRFERNRNKLFTFLDCDGVPWNNNNAEHAIKAFAKLRDVMSGFDKEGSPRVSHPAEHRRNSRISGTRFSGLP